MSMVGGKWDRIFILSFSSAVLRGFWGCPLFLAVERNRKGVLHDPAFIDHSIRLNQG